MLYEVITEETEDNTKYIRSEGVDILDAHQFWKMNNLTLNEKKAFYVLIGIFVLFVFEYTLFDLRVISSNLEDILSIFILGAIGIYVYTQPRA